MIEDVHYISEMKSNILSVKQLMENDSKSSWRTESYTGKTNDEEQ
jgi:hypothetical protein